MNPLKQAIKESKEREEKATKGPWIDDDGAIITQDGLTGFNPWPGQCEYELCDNDSEFIAHARTWEPKWRKMVERCMEGFEATIGMKFWESKLAESLIRLAKEGLEK